MTMPAMDPQLREGYERGRRMLRRHDPTYYFATRRLPAELRPATHALYGYVRTADQIVDGPRRAPTPAERRAALDPGAELGRDEAHAPPSEPPDGKRSVLGLVVDPAHAALQEPSGGVDVPELVVRR